MKHWDDETLVEEEEESDVDNPFHVPGPTSTI